MTGARISGQRQARGFEAVNRSGFSASPNDGVDDDGAFVAGHGFHEVKPSAAQLRYRDAAMALQSAGETISNLETHPIVGQNRIVDPNDDRAHKDYPSRRKDLIWAPP